jgi:hypothetical protein
LSSSKSRFSAVMEPENLQSSSRNLFTGAFSEPAQSSSHINNPFKINFNPFHGLISFRKSVFICSIHINLDMSFIDETPQIIELKKKERWKNYFFLSLTF